jgi:2-isopropylmalate synthase
MEYVYHVKGEKMLIKIAELVKAAKALCADVEFIALDATRSDDDFIIAAAKEAVSSGANIVTLCDDAGILMPEQLASFVKSYEVTANKTMKKFFGGLKRKN